MQWNAIAALEFDFSIPLLKPHFESLVAITCTQHKKRKHIKKRTPNRRVKPVHNIVAPKKLGSSILTNLTCAYETQGEREEKKKMKKEEERITATAHL